MRRCVVEVEGGRLYNGQGYVGMLASSVIIRDQINDDEVRIPIGQVWTLALDLLRAIPSRRPFFARRRELTMAMTQDPFWAKP